MAQLCFWTKIRTKQWLVLGASSFQCTRAGFLCPKCDNFACLHTRQDQNELYLKRWCFFFAKIGIFCKSIAGLLSKAYTQPYSFGGGIKLIICQIRHELSFSIHEICSSWKKGFMADPIFYCKESINGQKTSMYLVINRYKIDVEKQHPCFVFIFNNK